MNKINEINLIEKWRLYESGKRFKKIRDEKLYPAGKSWTQFCMDNTDYDKREIQRSIDFYELCVAQGIVVEKPGNVPKIIDDQFLLLDS